GERSLHVQPPISRRAFGWRAANEIAARSRTTMATEWVTARLARRITRFADQDGRKRIVPLEADAKLRQIWAAAAACACRHRNLSPQGRATAAATCTASCTVQNVAAKLPYCGGPCAQAYLLLLQSPQSSA